MTEPELDADGYPTQETLDAIRGWPIITGADCEKLLQFVQKGWRYPAYCRRAPRRQRRFHGGPLRRIWKLSTGGWSGHESMIYEMQENFFFWTLAWVSSRRGGHYEFETED